MKVKPSFHHPFHGVVWWLSDVNRMEAYFYSFLLPSLPLFTFLCFVLRHISEFLSGKTNGSCQKVFPERTVLMYEYTSTHWASGSHMPQVHQLWSIDGRCSCAHNWANWASSFIVFSLQRFPAVPEV